MVIQKPHICYIFAMNKRSTTADEYRKLYHTKQWRSLRGLVLTRHKFRCQRCKVTLTNGRSDPRSAIVHHIKPHKGNLTLFYDPDNLEAVCWSCHSGAIQSQEALGYDTTIGADGWPVDAKHPSY
ncbi:MAG: HNH endonuclease [Rhodobacteraceae bacterium]|nr:HNH endonuclease [Paracoccaceae bacterium]